MQMQSLENKWNCQWSICLKRGLLASWKWKILKGIQERSVLRMSTANSLILKQWHDEWPQCGADLITSPLDGDSGFPCLLKRLLSPLFSEGPKNSEARFPDVKFSSIYIYFQGSPGRDPPISSLLTNMEEYSLSLVLLLQSAGPQKVF